MFNVRSGTPNNLTVENIRAGNSNLRNPILASYAARVCSRITDSLRECREPANRGQTSIPGISATVAYSWRRFGENPPISGKAKHGQCPRDGDSPGPGV